MHYVIWPNGRVVIRCFNQFVDSINRIGAYIIGSRATQKCILQALLEPKAKLREYEDNGQYFERLALWVRQNA